MKWTSYASYTTAKHIPSESGVSISLELRVIGNLFLQFSPLRRAVFGTKSSRSKKTDALHRNRTLTEQKGIARRQKACHNTSRSTAPDDLQPKYP